MTVKLYTTIHAVVHDVASCGKLIPLAQAYFVLFERDRNAEIIRSNAPLIQGVRLELETAERQHRLVWIAPAEYENMFEIVNQMFARRHVAVEIDATRYTMEQYLRWDLEHRLHDSLGKLIDIKV